MKLSNFLSILVLSILTSTLSAIPIYKEIDSGWQFKQVRFGNWYPAIVPGVVHTDLINNQLIEDPYFRLNERDMQWIDKEDWIYETNLYLSDEMYTMENIRLLFKGLDTYADVYLNDEKILEADNMFREWKVDIKKLLKGKENKLKIYFHSPIKKTMPEWAASPVSYFASNDQSQNGGVFDSKVSVFTRKAGYHYGWDWGPRLVTSGIWRPVILEAWNDVKIENIQFVQENVSARKANIKTSVEILSQFQSQTVKIQVIDNTTNKLIGETVSLLEAGLNTVDVDFVMNNPKLWWSNGLGKAHLYNFTTRVLLGNEIKDEQSNRIGIRSIEVIRQPDKEGIAFYFKLNGIPVFSKGANYIPSDMFLPRVTKDDYKKTIMDAANANMNMLRIWGGGIYEDDYFYDLCDENGILIWQDFMFACSVYPSDGKLKENIRQEAIDNIRRLRNHASLAIWCGNNEIMDAIFNWGWMGKYKKENLQHEDIVLRQYFDLFHELLPQVVSQHNPQTYYLPTSPYCDMKGTRDENAGDYHYWTTWQQGLPIETFNKVRSRYFSEYGFQSFPTLETVKKYAPESQDHNIYSDVMMWHQRGGMNANRTIEKVLTDEYGEANDFESFLYMSQLLQGDAMKIAIEAHRRDMPFCMGSLYWQHNDCWPVASWSSRDYYGQWKAQHYFARKAFEDILISPIEEDNKLNIYVVSDRQDKLKCELAVQVLTLDGEIVSDFKKNIIIDANMSSIPLSIDMKDVLKNDQRENVFIRTSLTDKEGKVYDNIYLLAQQKNMNFMKPDISKTIKAIDGGYQITLKSNKFARGVFLSIEGVEHFFDNNFFDLLPQQAYNVRVTTMKSLQEMEKQLKITSVADAITPK